MNRRDFFRQAPKAAAVVGGAVVAVKAVAEEKPQPVEEPMLLTKQILNFPYPVTGMTPYKDRMLVCCADGSLYEVFEYCGIYATSRISA